MESAKYYNLEYLLENLDFDGKIFLCNNIIEFLLEHHIEKIKVYMYII